MLLVAATRIDRPARDVFRFVAVDHFRNHPRWDTNIIELTPLEPGPLAVGSRARVRRRRGGGTDEVLEVVEFQPPRLFSTRDNIGPFLLNATCIIESAGDAATRLTLIADTTVAGPTRMAAPLLKLIFARQMRRSLRSIKEMVEAEEGPAHEPAAGE